MSKQQGKLDTVMLVIELLRRIPRNRKVTASELHQELRDAGWERDLRTVQRQLDAQPPELQPESQEFEKFLRTLAMNAPRMDVFANLTAKPYEGDFAATLAKQMCSPVRFTETVANMKARGVEEFVEVGPGKVLTGLVQRG